MNKNTEHITTDILIIGTGHAGCRAAIAAADAGVGSISGENVLMLNKGEFLASGSSFYPWVAGIGYSGSLPDLMPEDSPDVHFQDVMNAGAETCDHELVRILTQEAEARLRDLNRLGVPVKALDTGQAHGGPGLCFNTYWRGDGMKIEDLRSVYASQLRKRGISIRDNVSVVSLLGEPGRCGGALAVSRDGTPIVITAKATIIASGGASPVFRHYLDTPELTGDGYALALRAGAELVNLEFFQIAWGIVEPREAVLPAQLNLYNNPSMEGKLPRFVNSRGEEFFDKYLPDDVSLMECIKTRLWHYPFSTRLNSKWFDIGIFTEVKEGRGSANNAIWADFRGLVDEPAEKPTHETVGGKYKKPIADAWSRPVELSLLVHAFNGGIKIDGNAHTGVNNLFACGECTGGMHSADRLGGMAAASTQVFGKRAGEAAARAAAESPAAPPSTTQVDEHIAFVRSVLGRDGGVPASAIRRRIQETMWINSMICKNEADLTRCIDELELIRDRDLPRVRPDGSDSDIDLFGALDIHNLWQTAHIIATVSRERKESRGPHYRTDFPEPSDTFAGSYVIRPLTTAADVGPGKTVKYTPELTGPSTLQFP